MKTTKFKFAILMIAIAFVTVSCSKGSSIDAAISQIDKAVSKVEKNKTSMTQADWEALNAELEEPAKVLSDALNSNDIGMVKKIKISTAMLRYTTVIGEAAMHTVSDSLKTMMNDTHLADSIAVATEQLQNLIDSDELKKAIEDMQKELQPSK